jgi:aminopeptidase N
MVEGFLTLETFRTGISNFLRAKQFQSAKSFELWEALTKAGHEDGQIPLDITVKDFTDSWTYQPGYPVTTVVKSEESFVKLKQNRFFLNPRMSSNLTWDIPISIVYPMSEGADFSKTSPSEWMLKSKTYLYLELTERPYILNIQQTGFYRVNYDARNWKDLANVLKNFHTKIHLLNRAQIIEDSFHLARAKQLDYQIALSLTEYLFEETEFIPWQAAFRSFSFFDLTLNDASTQTEYSYFKQYVIYLLTPMYNRLGFNNRQIDSYFTILFRRSVLNLMCQYGHKDAVNQARAMFVLWMRNPAMNKIDINLLDIVYITAIKEGGETEWNFLWERFLKSSDPSERQKMSHALGATKKQQLVIKYLDYTLSGNFQFEDLTYMYESIGAFETGQQVQFEWMQTNWAKLRGKFQQEHFESIVYYIITGYVTSARTQTELSILESFLQQKSSELSSISTELNMMVETAKLNMQWTLGSKPAVSIWLKTQVETSFSGKYSLGCIM